jgi:hypothetical protein
MKPLVQNFNTYLTTELGNCYINLKKRSTNLHMWGKLMMYRSTGFLLTC